MALHGRERFGWKHNFAGREGNRRSSGIVCDTVHVLGVIRLCASPVGLIFVVAVPTYSLVLVKLAQSFGP